ncbi:type I restriction enzyme endonuclease domain-containing protein [Streptomyces sp. NPDC050703]|uniref:type I restriction enzyme endonuclease domain-containing protein n=1 Tax=Streptomyces sp. NPDC050703 TaxID=3157218 RepID=UPI00342EDEE6
MSCLRSAAFSCRSTSNSVRAGLRSETRRLLAINKYPPDEAPAAVELVIKQTEHFADEWSAKPAEG